eukprot:7381037-Prymnesium_polylepis.1
MDSLQPSCGSRRGRTGPCGLVYREAKRHAQNVEQLAGVTVRGCKHRGPRRTDARQTVAHVGINHVTRQAKCYDCSAHKCAA